MLKIRLLLPSGLVFFWCFGCDSDKSAEAAHKEGPAKAAESRSKSRNPGGASSTAEVIEKVRKQGLNKKSIASVNEIKGLAALTEAYQSAESIENFEDRVYFRFLLLGQLASEGRESEAMALISGLDGQVREMSLQSIFGGSSMGFADAKAFIEANVSEADKEMAWQGYVAQIGKWKDLGQLDVDFLASQGLAVSKGLAAALIDYAGAGDPSRRNEVSGILVGLVNKNLANKATVFGFFCPANYQDPRGYYESIQKTLTEYPGLQSVGLEEARKAIAGMMLKDPGAAMETILGSSGSDGEAMMQGMKNWILMDTSGALEWFAAKSASMSDTERSQCGKAISGHTADKGDFQRAIATAEAIPDPGFRETVLQEVYRKERKVIMEQAQRDPEVTVRALASEGSKFSSQGIEDALGVWLNKDAEQAYQWCQDQWENAGPEKSQYAAAAMARHAASAGDENSARQWLLQITDEKIKSRVEAELSATRKSD
ncbi:MAG TPA: hypothetical protein VGE67_06075 [Haloferula sp.]